MASSHSSHVDNLAEGLHKGKCKDCKFCLEYVTINNVLLVFKCVDCNKGYEKKSDEDLAKRSRSTYRFCDGDINKFLLTLPKVIYLY